VVVGPTVVSTAVTVPTACCGETLTFAATAK